jgi:hypothetical protein
MPGDFKGTVYKKIEWDIIHWPRKNKLIFFLSNLEKNWLSAYMDNKLNGEKSVKIQHILVNNRIRFIRGSRFHWPVKDKTGALR